MDKSIYVFHGTDHYIIQSKTKKVISTYHVDDFNVTYYDLEETSLEDALNDASTIPFMADKKIVVIKNCYIVTNQSPKKAIKHNIDAFQRYLSSPPQETILIVQVPYAKLDKRKAITKTLLDNASLEECKSVKGQDLNHWIKRQLGKQSISIDTDALEEMVKRTNGSTEILVNETQKLLYYAQDMRRVTLDTIKKVITKNVEDNVYEITNNILENNQTKALEIYNDLVMYSEDPLRILGILINKYREIFHVKRLIKKGMDQADITDYYGYSRGRVYYMMKNAKSVNEDVVLQHLKDLESLDYRIKTGQVDKRLGLELFILGT